MTRADEIRAYVAQLPKNNGNDLSEWLEEHRDKIPADLAYLLGEVERLEKLARANWHIREHWRWQRTGECREDCPGCADRCAMNDALAAHTD